jgi:xanthine dehydrogenase molybdenum-binding subunit
MIAASGYYEVKFQKGTFNIDGFKMANGAVTFGTQVAQVLVDLETGTVKVEDLWIVIDAGRIIHLNGALGQVEGGAAMGFGQAIMEELLTRESQTINNSLDSYLIPTAMDMPAMHIEFLEYPHKLGPFGAKGLGEAAVLPTSPAIINAVCQAISAPINSMPACAEKVLETLKKK